MLNAAPLKKQVLPSSAFNRSHSEDSLPWRTIFYKTFMSTQFINEVLRLTNLERTSRGLNELTLNAQLNQAAQGHSDNMASQDFFDHTGADGSNVGDRVGDAGYAFRSTGENIAAGQTTPEQVVESWMNSPGHRANILNADYQEIGIGYEYLAEDTGSVNYNHYWTQVFGTHQSGNVTPISDPQPAAPIEIVEEPAPIVNDTSDLEPDSQDTPIVENPSPAPQEPLQPQQAPLNDSLLTETPDNTLDNSSADLEPVENDAPLDNTSDINLFGASMGGDLNIGEVNEGDITGSDDNLAMAGSDEAITADTPTYSYAYTNSNGSAYELTYTDSNMDAANPIESLESEPLGAANSNFEHYELESSDFFSANSGFSYQQGASAAMERFARSEF